MWSVGQWHLRHLQTGEKYRILGTIFNLTESELASKQDSRFVWTLKVEGVL